ncbi:MAG TPA: AAA family ATPase [Acidimicrobiia bacterium]
MQFIVRPGTDPVAKADASLLKAMGLPFGGTIRVGRTHVLVQGGQMTEPSALALGPLATANAGTSPGASIEATRAVLPTAFRVVIAGSDLPIDPRHLLRALQGRPVSSGDSITLEPGYAGGEEEATLRVAQVDPDGAGTIGAATAFVSQRDAGAADVPTSPGRAEAPSARAPGPAPTQAPREEPPAPPLPTTADALLAGLDAERDLMSGWFRLLTSPDDLPAAWGLPRVAGVVLEGPNGCGKTELVAAAAAEVGVPVKEVVIDQVFKPERLLDLLEAAVKTVTTPHVIFVDRLEVVLGEEGMAPFRTQASAVLRWYLDAVVQRKGLATVLGVSTRHHLDEGIGTSPLLPRTLSIPPPDLTRRKLLFTAALARVPSEELDFDKLAARSAGFSGADVVAAVIHASTRVAGGNGKLTTDTVVSAIEGTTPSLGSVPMGEMPTFGFSQVADLAEVKQRLTEAVIWPITDPARFKAIGIEPPRGLLLFGPPGTGKTFVVRALAHEAGAAFFSVKGAELLDKYVGESERGVRELFSRARSAAPSIIFFDELDALAPVRGRSTTTVTDSVVAALLTELDGVAERGDVSVIGATNRRDLVDPALLRAGRFEIQIELGLPDAAARRALLDVSDVPFAEDVDLDRLADETDGMSFADLSGLLREAALEALRGDLEARQVGSAQLAAALGRWRAGRQ